MNEKQQVKIVQRIERLFEKIQGQRMNMTQRGPDPQTVHDVDRFMQIETEMRAICNELKSPAYCTMPHIIRADGTRRKAAKK